jgi:digeranylgeranylglycerophospholipid reductase
MQDFNVIVVGAGPGGCLAARDIARKGFRVGLFEASDEANHGQAIVVEVERDVFKAVGVEEPSGDLVAYRAGCVKFISARNTHVFTFDERNDPLPVAIFHDRFTHRLRDEAKAAGTRLHFGHRALGPVVDGVRVCGIEFEHKGRVESARAPLVIDATGFAAAVVRRLPGDCGITFPDSGRHVVVAENRLHAIDPSKAASAVERGLHPDNELLSRVGDYGAYSTVYSYLSLEQERAYILVGLKQDWPFAPPVSVIVDHFIETQGYYGQRLHGGGAQIRIRHSLDKMVADGFMAIGEAACTVVPVHGSGVASALYTARGAAKVACAALENGDTSTSSLWPYAAQYQRGRGRALAGFDVTRLSIDRLTPDESADLLESGLMHRDDVLHGLVVDVPGLDPATVPGRIPALLKHPLFVPVVARMGVTMNGVLAHYARYPVRYDPSAFQAWVARKWRLFGPLLG